MFLLESVSLGDTQQSAVKNDENGACIGIRRSNCNASSSVSNDRTWLGVHGHEPTKAQRISKIYQGIDIPIEETL
jgi:hypothetical protein